ncbi:MAG TPA: class I SAM-dependent methyltransferase [Desulfobaccales bacterium]|nr:class I SAM-dependent methyltransferase [Desulfobaccales bacterium]
MKLNWAERLIVNNPVRVLIQRLIIRWIKDVTNLSPEARVLEIGCGRGAGACLIQEKFNPAVMHAFDLDHDMILRAGRYVKARRQEKISFYVGNALWLPYRNEVLDAVFGFGVLHHLPDWRGGLREIARVLKPGGIYFLEEFYPQFYQNFLFRHIFIHPEHDRFRSPDLHQALAEAGFELQGCLEQKMLGILAVSSKQ